MTTPVIRRSLLAAGAFLLGATFLALRPLPARAARTNPDAFLAEAREATRRYQSRQAAIDDGFTLVGGEFPAMGEHWVSFARVMEDTLDARRPSVLIYVNTTGGPRLAGVAYSRLLSPGKAPPAFPFEGAWHEHSGAVSDESLPHGHGAHHDAMPAEPTGDSPRFWILHAWVWSANPDGPFTTDNWSLPLVRLGIADGGDASRDAVRALALAADADGYHLTTISRWLTLGARDDSIVAAVIERRRTEAREGAEAVRATHALTPDASLGLAHAWDGMWNDLAAALPSRGTELAGLRTRL